MATIVNGKYSAFDSDVKALIEKAAHIYLTIANDSEGASLSKENTGNDINKKLLVSMDYTYPHTDAASGKTALGTFKITFADGTFISVTDEDSSHWYLLEGTEPYVFKHLV